MIFLSQFYLCFCSFFFFLCSFVCLFFWFGKKSTASWKATEFPPHQSTCAKSPPSLSPADSAFIQSASTPLLSLPRPWPISSEQLGWEAGNHFPHTPHPGVWLPVGCYCMRSACSCWGWYWPKAAAAAAADPGVAVARGCCTAYPYPAVAT